MRALSVSALLVVVVLFSASCGVCNGTTTKPGVTLAPTPSDDTEGPDIFWGHVNDTLHALPRAWQEARRTHPNYLTNQADADGLSDPFDAGNTNYIGALDQRNPPPGLETQFATLKAKLRAFLDTIHASPANGAAIDAAYNEYVTACEAVQQFADANNANVDLLCSGLGPPLSAADFFATIAPAIATMHSSADAAKSALGSQTDATSLNAYLSGLVAAYGKAANDVIDPTAPDNLAASQKVFADAANAVVPAAEELEKETTSAGAAANVSSTLAPALAAVEDACGALQTAATAAGVSTDLACRP